MKTITYPKLPDGREYDDDVKQKFDFIAGIIRKIVRDHVPEVRNYILDRAKKGWDD